jgi:hypothetical protein
MSRPDCGKAKLGKVGGAQVTCPPDRAGELAVGSDPTSRTTREGLACVLRQVRDLPVPRGLWNDLRRSAGRCGAAIDVSGSPLLSRRVAGGEDIYTIVGCWMRPVSCRVNAKDSFSDALAGRDSLDMI